MKEIVEKDREKERKSERDREALDGKIYYNPPNILLDLN